MPTFSDVPESHFAYHHIEAAYAAGLIKGTAVVPPLAYSPDATVTVEQALAILSNAVNWLDSSIPNKDASMPEHRSDMTQDNTTFFAHVQNAFKLGIAGGPERDYWDKTQCERGASVSRAWAASFVIRARNLDLITPETARFPTDVPTTHAFFRYIETMAYHGITAGTSATEFSPDTYMTRAQFAVFVVEAFDVPFVTLGNVPG